MTQKKEEPKQEQIQQQASDPAAHKENIARLNDAQIESRFELFTLSYNPTIFEENQEEKNKKE